jgi:hypothetical protein
MAHITLSQALPKTLNVFLNIAVMLKLPVTSMFKNVLVSEGIKVALTIIACNLDIQP